MEGAAKLLTCKPGPGLGAYSASARNHLSTLKAPDELLVQPPSFSAASV